MNQLYTLFHQSFCFTFHLSGKNDLRILTNPGAVHYLNSKKVKRVILVLAFSFFCFNSFAQSNEATPSTELIGISKLELGLQGIGLGHELPLGEKWSLNLSAGLGGGYSIAANGFHSSWIINQPVAYFRSELKYTYNRNKRFSKSKSILNNAGNYVAFQTKYTTNRVFGSNEWNNIVDPLNRTLLNEVHWGIQRPLGQRFIFNFHVGLGYASDFDFKNSQLYPAAGVQFAYILSRNRKL